MKALFNQVNRDFNADLADETKEFIRGRIGRQMAPMFKKIKESLTNFDASKLKSAPTLQLEIELDLILGGMKTVYRDFKAKISAVNNRLDRAAKDLDFLTIRRINTELKTLGGIAKDNEGQARDVFADITDLIQTKFGSDFNPRTLGLTIEIPDVKGGIKELYNGMATLMAKADKLEEDFRKAA